MSWLKPSARWSIEKPTSLVRWGLQKTTQLRSPGLNHDCSSFSFRPLCSESAWRPDFLHSGTSCSCTGNSKCNRGLHKATRPDKKCVIFVPVAAAQKILGATARCTKPALALPSRVFEIAITPSDDVMSPLAIQKSFTRNIIMQHSKVQRHTASISNLCTVKS